VVNVNGTSEPTGVTSIANAQFASKFALFDSIARFDVKTPSERWPVAIIGDFVQNTRACANVGNILPTPVNTATIKYTQSENFSCDPRQRRGYWAEAEIGRILQKHDLQFGYTRMFIEREAVLSNLNYNQMYPEQCDSRFHRVVRTPSEFRQHESANRYAQAAAVRRQLRVLMSLSASAAFRGFDGKTHGPSA
jgi:hypothetical protein